MSNKKEYAPCDLCGQNDWKLKDTSLMFVCLFEVFEYLQEPSSDAISIL